MIFPCRFAAEFAEPVVDVHPSLRHRKETLPDGSARTGKVEKIGHGNCNCCNILKHLFQHLCDISELLPHLFVISERFVRFHANIF